MSWVFLGSEDTERAPDEREKERFAASECLMYNSH